ncbi:MAG: flagellar basal body rod protein FlgC [Oscillospiraceae bacterium]|nr:flagellar basal body rod protein FlgC [Oscillospiraceae bacterium]
MAFLSSFDIPISGMTAQQFRLDIIAQNVANGDDYATRPEDVYKRQMVVFNEDKTFKRILWTKMGQHVAKRFTYVQLRGVECTRVVEDPTPPTPVYSPNNPLADEYGYVYETNVDIAVEEMDAMEASNMYNANVEVWNVVKAMASAALRIGQG